MWKERARGLGTLVWNWVMIEVEPENGDYVKRTDQ